MLVCGVCISAVARAGWASSALDSRLGIDGHVSPQARRLLCLAASSWSFAQAEQKLAEFCGIRTSDFTIREVCQSEAQAMLQWQRESAAARQPFVEAQGDIEFTTDGTSVNTTEGWREMKIGIFAKRLRAEPATPAQWDDRVLPKPHVRVAFVAIEKADRFSSRWRHWMTRLGIQDPAEISVLADGARWIWDRARIQFPGANGTLDIYHGVEHIADTAERLYGEGAPETKRWTDDGRTSLLHGGWPELQLQIAAAQQTHPRLAQQRSLEHLRAYFTTHQEHLNYRQRLAEGRAIGSGIVEGAAKNLVGRRLKQTGARWRVRRVNRMAGLCGCLYSDHWDAYWNQIAA